MFIRQPKIAGEQHVGAGCVDVADFLGDDGIGNVGILHAEGAAETAADIRIRHLPDFDALDIAKQLARLFAWTPSSRRPEQES
jgi:hypothetical protein